MRRCRTPQRVERASLSCAFVVVIVVGVVVGARIARASSLSGADESSVNIENMRASWTVTDDDHEDASWRVGEGDASDTLVRYNNVVRRYLHALAPASAWDASERFLKGLDSRLLSDANANGAVLHEFNDLPSVKHLDVSVRLDYHAMRKNGNLDRLVDCDVEARRGDGDAWCMGLEASAEFFERHRRWWKHLRDAHPEGHPYFYSEYMEFDMHDGGVDPTASVFLEHSTSPTGRHDEYVPALREYFEAIGATVSDHLYENVQRVIDVATGDEFSASVWAAGIMFSRSSEAQNGRVDGVRLLMHFRRRRSVDTRVDGDKDDAEDDGYRSDKVRQMARFLDLLEWTGDFDEFDRIDDFLIDEEDIGSVLQVDVFAAAPSSSHPSVIGPRVGVEMPIAVSDPSKNILPQLTSLVTEGLAEESWWRNFTSALCADGRLLLDASNLASRIFRPCAVSRRTAADKRELRLPNGAGILPMIPVTVSHIKFVAQPRRRLYVKAYTTSHHARAYCLDSDSITRAGSTAEYVRCTR